MDSLNPRATTAYDPAADPPIHGPNPPPMHVRTPSLSTTPPARLALRLPQGASYLLVLVLFVGFAVAASAFKPGPTAGLADDPDVRRAQALLGPGSDQRETGLRMRSSLMAPEADGAVPSSGAALTRAAALLERARARRPLDPRVAAACGTLDLARGKFERAEARFRAALATGAPYPEARLLLGVTLAERARLERAPQAIRAFELRAIAQFAAVPGDAPELLPALYNRALLLARVGRAAEARELARDYFALDPGSAWAERLAREIARPG